MSHEIRTPMNAVIGMSELVLETDLTPEQREHLEITHHSAVSLLHLINDILDFSKIEAGKLDLSPTQFNPRESIRGVLRGLYLEAERKGLKVREEIDEEVPEMLHGDPHRLGQVLVNLLSNAIKFTEKGWVSLRVTKVKSTDNRIVLRFTVEDTGIGIPKKKLNRIFESFEQADGSTTRVFGGTGLGLAIAKKLVSLMSGSIVVESREGKGSQFSFQAVFQEAGKEKRSGPSREGPNTTKQDSCLSGKRVLLVEDNRVNRALAERLLHKLGLTVDMAFDGRQALGRLAKQQYDAVLMDIQMPEMDGYSTTARFREMETHGNPHLPIIAMTANAMKGDEEKCLLAGMDDYLTKPINRKELERVLRKWMKAE